MDQRSLGGLIAAVVVVVLAVFGAVAALAGEWNVALTDFGLLALGGIAYVSWLHERV